jgi:small GTP-binding protein
METYKTVVLGDEGVGKSAFVIRFIQGNFVEYYDPTIEDSYRKKIEVNGKSCVLDILDTVETEYNAMGGRYLRTAQAVIIAYSITDEKSFLNVETISEDFLRSIDSDETPCFIVGLKCDLENQRKVSFEAGKEMSKKLKANGFFEASAKNEINIQEVFMTMTSFLMLYGGEMEEENDSVLPTPVQKKKKKNFNCLVM